ncbi:MAG: rod shape-determining protein [Deltaproteobacteria bacterium]|nr:rod shape-determining protein [Deltaproteobacteria bacterium]
MAIVQGIDVGSWRVRVATMEGSFRRFVLRDVTEMESSVGTAQALEAIRAQEPGWEQADKASGFPLDRGAMRLVTLPFTDRATVAKALPAEVESSVPYDLEDMVLATQLVDTDKGKSRTRAVIAPKAALEATLELLRAAGAEPKALVLDAEALASFADRGVQAVIDVGHGRTILALAQGGQLVAARLVPIGGHAMTLAIAEALHLPEAEAEGLKHASTIPAGTASTDGWSDAEPTDADRKGVAGHAAAEAALLEVVDELIVELRARLIALEDELSLGIDEVLLAGGGSLLGGFPARLSLATGVPVRSVLVPGGHPASCALAVAYARVAADDVKPLDLRVGEYAYRGHADVMWTAASWGALATAAAVLLSLGVSAYRLSGTWADGAEVDAELVDTVTRNFPEVDESRLADSSVALSIFTEKAAEAAARVAALGPAVSGEPPTLTMLKALSTALPPNQQARIDVRELNISADAVSFKAETDSYESAANIEERLKGTERFAQARKSEEKKSSGGLTFNMSIPLGAVEGEGEGEGAPEGAPVPEPGSAPEGKEG